VEGYLSGHFTSEKPTSEEDNEDKAHKIIELYEKLDWNQSKIANLLPILKFYESLRHCVAHNVGIPSGKIIQIYNSDEFKQAIDQWKTKFPDREISPPPMVTDISIDLKPHHPIIYSETCLRIASDINANLIKQLGRKHFIERTIKKHLSDPPLLSKPVCQNLTRYISFHLNNDYKIALQNYDDIYEVFDNLEKEAREQKIKECKRRYHTLKNIQYNS
jgi:hypothetical protein